MRGADREARRLKTRRFRRFGFFLGFVAVELAVLGKLINLRVLFFAQGVESGGIIVCLQVLLEGVAGSQSKREEEK